MDPVGIDRTHILVLNHNGRDLLADCLPSILEAARSAGLPCPVSVVDNASTDGSVAWLAANHPEVGLFREPNRGLASFNAVLARLDEPAVLLLNNDVKLERDAIRPLIDALRTNPDALFSAPKCWDFGGRIYEGMRTRVRSRFGLVQGLCRTPGHERTIDEPGLTASAGPILAVDRRKFLELGGYDPLYFPGRIEDLDLGFRAWLAGWRGYYVPESVAYHRGFASFGPAFGRDGCDRLAARNTILFAWKNLAGARLVEHFAWLLPRALFAFATRRTSFLSALGSAWRKRSEAIQARKSARRPARIDRQEAFFHAFRW